MDLVPIKVKLGLKGNGHADFPDFNSLQVVKASGLDWSVYVDAYGTGWKYDKTSGHREDTVDSPVGQQWGMLLVPKEFATEACLAFPAVCTKLTDADAQAFYEQKVTVYEDSEIIRGTVLADIKAKQDLGIALTAEQLKAINPNDPTPGIVINPVKSWSGFKAKKNIKVVQ